MRIFLRHNRTGHYYNGNSEWAMEPADAKDLGGIEGALDLVADENLDGMSLVIRYDARGGEQVFDLTEGLRADDIANSISTSY